MSSSAAADSETYASVRGVMTEKAEELGKSSAWVDEMMDYGECLFLLASTNYFEAKFLKHAFHFLFSPSKFRSLEAKKVSNDRLMFSES